MTTRSPPVTRKAAAAAAAATQQYEDSPASPSELTSHAPLHPPAPVPPATLRVYDDYPASPSDLGPSLPPPAPRPAAHPAPRPATHLASAITSDDAVNTRTVHRAPSARSQRSASSMVARIRQVEFEAEERLAQIRRQELQIQTELIKKKLAADVATIREETDRESLGGNEAMETEHRVSDWLQRHQPREEPKEYENIEKRYQSPTTNQKATERYPRTEPNQVRLDAEPEPVLRHRSPTPNRTREKGIDRLAEAIERIAEGRRPARQSMELPIFSGAIAEWLPFKAAMRESTILYKVSPTENLARLRTSLRGEAKQAVSALLYTATEPSIIMKTLEQCYGRPEMIIDRALQDIKKLPRLGASASELNTFAIELQNIVTAIACMDERGYLQNPMLAREVTEKLTPHVKSKWCDYAEDIGSQNEADIIILSRFLMREADRAMRHMYTMPPAASQNTSAGPKSKKPPQPRQNERNRQTVCATAEDKKKECLCCGSEHSTPECDKIAAMPVEQRWEWAKETRICFQCLNNKHRRTFCKNKRCGIDGCIRPHHKLLHVTREKTERESQADSAVTASAHVTERNQVLLKICPITVEGRNGKRVETYALLDEGSTITLIDEEIAHRVGAHGPTRALHIVGATSSQKETESQIISVNIRGQGQNEGHSIKARTVRNLILGTQSVKMELLQQPHLRNLQLKNVCYTDAKPRVLIGADNWHLIVTRKLLTGKRNQPAASLTQLGWIVHGSVPRSTITQTESVLHIRTMQSTQSEKMTSERDDELSELVKAHFEIDALGVSMNRKPVPKHERAKAIFDLTAKRVNGHFEVGLPWATDDVTLPPSYNMALQRLHGIERKMDRSPDFKEAYTAQVEKLFDKGYAVRSDGNHDKSPRLWYLPHFAVTNPNKPGKVRMVFDAAAKANGLCLNDVLLDGPDLLQSLYGILFRFRTKPIAVTADIREMFLRVKIRPQDQVAQQFLWRGEERSEPPQKYTMTSMIFGARSSPFIAHSVRDRNASEYKESHPLAFKAITESHYMDDWVDSFATEEIAERAIREVQEVHAKAGFELAGWSSNRNNLLKGIPEANQTHAPKELAANANLYGKTLGILWLTTSDELAFNTEMNRVPEDVRRLARTPTKREALGAVMSLFDPLGLLSPYTINAKILLQELWKKKIEWDETLPPEEASAFAEWEACLRNISNLRLPRWYGANLDASGCQLHMFCDTSEQAFAAVAYWRFKTHNGISVRIVAGKAKVAPMKAQSIPRLELQASLIAARLASEIVKSHRTNSEVIFWSDSRTVLHWIRNDAVKYTPYVAHRLSEIAELTRPEQWRWVPTAHNVADDATRKGNMLLHNEDRWFTGPAFLYEDEDQWPTEDRVEPEQDEVGVTYTTKDTPLIEVSRFSSYSRLVRALAYVLLFVDKSRRRAKEMELKYMERAERLLISAAQNDSFPNELSRLRKGQNVERTSRLYKLDPMYKDELICLNDRINAATVPEKLKNPPIIDGKHPLARLLIRNEHVKNNHIGREQIVNSIRLRYWVLRLRTTVRSIVNECALCKARRAQPKIPVKGDLPQARLTTHTRPFSRCGVDCFGPMWIVIGRRREKRWGMLFTCLVTRAIHIELIASLSTDSAIMAIRRMAARRGMPALIMSDNGTNFRGADVEMTKAYKEWLPAMKDHALSRRTKWEFIDPGAPNQGGAWERMIKTVKSSLAMILKEHAPKEETLATLMTEVEHTVNSRPLTHVSTEPEDEEALTPNHFLLGTATGLPFVGDIENPRKTWLAAQELANKFWARWVTEYLPTLAPRGDVRSNHVNVKRGDIVIIADGLLPRNVWPRGLVESVYPGPDGVVRSAEVRTKGGVFRRPVRRLIVLPVTRGCEDLRRGENVADNET